MDLWASRRLSRYGWMFHSTTSLWDLFCLQGYFWIYCGSWKGSLWLIFWCAAETTDWASWKVSLDSPPSDSWCFSHPIWQIRTLPLRPSLSWLLNRIIVQGCILCIRWLGIIPDRSSLWPLISRALLWTHDLGSTIYWVAYWSTLRHSILGLPILALPILRLLQLTLSILWVL